MKFRLFGPIGITVVPDLRVRRVRTTDAEDKYPRTKFALKLGITYHLPDRTGTVPLDACAGSTSWASSVNAPGHSSS